jgi:hypothetical protein
MTTKAKRDDEQFEVKRYAVQYPISAYTFPNEALIHQVRFDEQYLHVELTDGRLLAVPLWWIPTVYNASPAEREKFEINQSRTMIIWNPDKCAINDELRIANYLCMVPELAREIERTRIEAGLTVEELLAGLREQRERYYAEKYQGDDEPT